MSITYSRNCMLTRTAESDDAQIRRGRAVCGDMVRAEVDSPSAVGEGEVGRGDAGGAARWRG